jgi:hypothetical protein
MAEIKCDPELQLVKVYLPVNLNTDEDWLRFG